ncbi:MAG: Asp-tRNA(Asn)/Glu-tRNA(Gln) amidotransferase subunit GatA [Opitutae bacterium]|nr:Asp-tRNA(Asn)/Glu-tRNA(Gln) amidotransferase subunit GatA [Opitutae bacterium]
MDTALIHQPLSALTGLLAERRVSSVEMMAAFIARTKAVEPRLHAFNSFDEPAALAAARASDERRTLGRILGPLDGIPIGIKDAIAVAGAPLTCSSKMLANFVSPYDATVIERLRAGGAIPWGRLNLDEFAMGSSTENSANGVTLNPWDLTRVAGGSSGGSAAAVAASQAPAALGSDTGGSIRQPAAFCGLVGVKPTYGTVSRYGLAAFASSLDQIGPLTRNVDDAALLLGVIAGHDPRDSTSLARPAPDFPVEMVARRGPWKLGVPAEYFREGLDPAVAAAVRKAIDFYSAQGGEIREVSLPVAAEYAIAAYYIIATAECSSNLARYDGIRYGHRTQNATDAIDLYARSRAEGFGDEVKRRILLGTYVLSSGYYDAYYLRAQKLRTLIRQDYLRALDGLDALVTPTTPTPAFRPGEKTADPLSMYLADIFTVGVNLAGLPAVSLPCGFTAAGLPVGLQLIGRHFEEPRLFAVARSYEQAHAWHKMRPTVASSE